MTAHDAAPHETSNRRHSLRLQAQQLGWPRPRMRVASVTLLLAIVFPLLAPDRSLISAAALAMITIALAQSWNLVLGYGGVWNFGQLAFYALGAYSAALLGTYLPISPWAAIPLAGLVSGSISLLLSVPVLRLRGIYVALLTFGFAEVVRLLIVADQSGVTGGSYGRSGFAGFDASLPLGISNTQALQVGYWASLGIALLTTLTLVALVRSPLGIGLVALRDNTPLAAARGINARSYQMLIFAISGFFAGAAGAVYAGVFGVASPTLMGLGPMTLLVTMLVVGGLGTITGPIVGTLVLSLVQVWLQDIPEIRLIVLGVVLLAVILVMPRGLVPYASMLWEKFQHWLDEDQAWEDDDYEDD